MAPKRSKAQQTPTNMQMRLADWLNNNRSNRRKSTKEGRKDKKKKPGGYCQIQWGVKGGWGGRRWKGGGKRLGSERSGGIELALAAVKVGSVASLEEEKEQKRTEKASIVSSYLSKDQGSLFLFVSRRMEGETERERERERETEKDNQQQQQHTKKKPQLTETTTTTHRKKKERKEKNDSHCVISSWPTLLQFGPNLSVNTTSEETRRKTADD